MSELVIVYHRQPYEEVLVDGEIIQRENKSPNGIVPTLKSFFGRADGGSWVAWKASEDGAADFERVITIEDSYGTYRVSRLPLTAEQVTSFYHVTSKEAMWPILHSFKERYNYDPVDWPTFREVNWLFAEAAAAEATEGSVIWVHDYNLWLVPQYIKRINPKLKVAFFHHTPFPAADMFNVMPWRVEIIESLLSCDVIGFHVPRYTVNFVSTAKSLFDCEVLEEIPVRNEFSSRGMALSESTVPIRLGFAGREILLSSHPVGIDVDYITTVAQRDDASERMESIIDDLNGCRLIISVSRTDYTKGGAELLSAYERLFERRPELIGKIRLMHVSVEANRDMAAYQEVQREIESLTGHINGKFGSFEWQPVSLLSKPVKFDELVSYYRAADICWITPLADGLNLVAAEFVAAQKVGDDVDVGTLVLSEFAGAAVELSDALLVNPFSHRYMDAAIDQALDMPMDERRERMKAMKRTVRELDIKAWADEQQRVFDAIKGTNPAKANTA
ncbi:MAG: glucosylglycerol-phosphate synthase [Pseudomonadota bacterium]